MTTEKMKPVAEFWGVEACGTDFIKDYKDRSEFFEKYREFRYRTLWFIPEMVPFASAKGKKVLEIGIGNGVDGAMFAKHGADYTGADLTQAAVVATREHFEILGLDGRFAIENAEQLSFKDDAFDIVYSHGVLHHTPDPRHAFREVHRVLKPGGRAIVMLYHKHSFNYYVRIMTYMRLRVLLKVLSRWGRWQADRQAKQDWSILGVRGNQGEGLWEGHYKNFLDFGWRYFSADNFVHRCADGPGCPWAYVFTRSEARGAFSMFSEVETKVAHFPLRQRLGGWFPLSLERKLAAMMGWNLMVFARK